MSEDDKPTTDKAVSKLRTTPDAVSGGVNQLNAGDKEVRSFCGRGPSQVNALVTRQVGPGQPSDSSVKICDLCVNAARAQLQETKN